MDEKTIRNYIDSAIISSSKACQGCVGDCRVCEYAIGRDLIEDIVDGYFELKELATPKKIKHLPWNGIDGVPYDLCPNCGTNLCTTGAFGRNKSQVHYCENCGQKLDWSDE